MQIQYAAATRNFFDLEIRFKINSLYGLEINNI